MHLPFDSAIPILEIYPEIIPLTIQKYIRTRLLIATLFVIAKYWKQSKCPYIAWLNKLWCIHTVECYAAF